MNASPYVDFDRLPDYKGPNGDRFPPLSFWPIENQTPKQATKLRRWHAEQIAAFQADKTLRFNPTLELLKYCSPILQSNIPNAKSISGRQDTRLLREGFEVFRLRVLDQFHDFAPEQ